MSMRITKTDMARVIVLALFNMKALPDAEDKRVIRMARHKADFLRIQHKRALAIIEAR